MFSKHLEVRDPDHPSHLQSLYSEIFSGRRLMASVSSTAAILHRWVCFRRTNTITMIFFSQIDTIEENFCLLEYKTKLVSLAIMS